MKSHSGLRWLLDDAVFRAAHSKSALLLLASGDGALTPDAMGHALMTMPLGGRCVLVLLPNSRLLRIHMDVARSQ